MAARLNQGILGHVFGVTSGAKGTRQRDEIAEQGRVSRVKPLRVDRCPHRDGLHAPVVCVDSVTPLQLRRSLATGAHGRVLAAVAAFGYVTAADGGGARSGGAWPVAAGATASRTRPVTAITRMAGQAETTPMLSPISH